MPKPKPHQDCRLVVFTDRLEEWFDALYPPKAGRVRPVSQPTDTIHDIANFLYESRPRLTAEEVREILHKSGAPPSWAKPSACVGAGTIVLRQSAALCEAQEAFYQLRRALSKWVVDLRCDRKLSEEATSFLAGQGADETGANWTRAVEYEALLRELNTAPYFYMTNITRLLEVAVPQRKAPPSAS